MCNGSKCKVASVCDPDLSEKMRMSFTELYKALLYGT
jgi:hypothetical protein